MKVRITPLLTAILLAAIIAGGCRSTHKKINPAQEAYPMTQPLSTVTEKPINPMIQK
jgi:PBP1b-binding outer membrane lipoprotein LpoB